MNPCEYLHQQALAALSGDYYKKYSDSQKQRAADYCVLLYKRSSYPPKKALEQMKRMIGSV